MEKDKSKYAASLVNWEKQLRLEVSTIESEIQSETRSIELKEYRIRLLTESLEIVKERLDSGLLENDVWRELNQE